MSTVPAYFAKSKPFLTRADALDMEAGTTTPSLNIIAYYCRVAVLDQAVAVLGTVPAGAMGEAEAWIGALMGRVEADKAKLGVTAEAQETHMSLIRSYALSVFKRADDADRAGVSDTNTAKMFAAAGTLLDVAKQISTTSDPQLDSMARYAKGRATDILTCLKEGRAPLPPDGIDPALAELMKGVDLGGAGGGAGAPPAAAPAPVAAPAALSLPAIPSAPPAMPAPASAPVPAPAPAPAPAPVLTHSLPPGYTPSAPYAPPTAPPAAAAMPPYAPPYAQPSAPMAPYAQPQPGYPGAPGAGAYPYPAPAPVVPAARPAGGPSHAGKGRSGLAPAQLADAMEVAKHAVAAIREEDIELAAQYLRQTLQILGRY